LVNEFDIKYEQAKAFKYLALEVNGAYKQIPDKITELMQLTAAQNLFPAMRGPVFAIFYNDRSFHNRHLLQSGYPPTGNGVESPLGRLSGIPVAV
jgi:DNA gyrase inhibitor GyrI